MVCRRYRLIVFLVGMEAHHRRNPWILLGAISHQERTMQTAGLYEGKIAELGGAWISAGFTLIFVSLPLVGRGDLMQQARTIVFL